MKRIICLFKGHIPKRYYYWNEISTTMGEHINWKKLHWSECERCEKLLGNKTTE